MTTTSATPAQQSRPDCLVVGDLSGCSGQASSPFFKRPARRKMKIPRRRGHREITPIPSTRTTGAQAHNVGPSQDPIARQRSRSDASGNNRRQPYGDSAAGKRSVPDATAKSTAVLPLTDAGHDENAALSDKLAERRKDPANCCCCGEPNNNGIRTCDRCREKKRQTNGKRKTKPETVPECRYLDTSGAAAYLGRTPGAVYELVAKRMIPFRRLGSRLVFDCYELDTYVDSLEGVDAEEAVSRTLNGGTVHGVGTPSAWPEN